MCLGAGTTVVRKSVAISANSTRTEVVWSADGGTSLPGATDAAPLVIRFTLQPKARLYSFWVSDDRCGASGGVVAGGGPGFDSSRDTRGSCGTASREVAENGQ